MLAVFAWEMSEIDTNATKQAASDFVNRLTEWAFLGLLRPWTKRLALWK